MDESKTVEPQKEDGRELATGQSRSLGISDKNAVRAAVIFLIAGSSFQVLVFGGVLTKRANVDGVFGLGLLGISLVSVLALGPYMIYQYRRKQRLEDALRQELSKERAMVEREQAALAKETRMRKRAELLQDILTHDMRNFIQISTLNAEMLKQNDLTETERARFADEILTNEGRSALLVDRAKQLGRILAVEAADLVPVRLVDSLSRSMETVSKSFASRKIEFSIDVDDGVRVLADDLLDEALTNVLSNAVAYTDGVAAQIRVSAGPDQLGDERYCKVSFTDHGKGMPDSLKQRAFTRYLESSHGSGLGLSIVYALVVERYSGKLAIKDRVPGDHTKGTVVEMWLRSAP